MKRVPGVGVGDFYLDPDTQRRWSNNPAPKTHTEGGHTIPQRWDLVASYFRGDKRLISQGRRDRNSKISLAGPTL